LFKEEASKMVRGEEFLPSLLDMWTKGGGSEPSDGNSPDDFRIPFFVVWIIPLCMGRSGKMISCLQLLERWEMAIGKSLQRTSGQGMLLLVVWDDSLDTFSIILHCSSSHLNVILVHLLT
jgi:hypothetical protein